MDAVLRRGVEGAHPLRRMTFGRRLRSRIWRGSVEDEVDAELEFHVAMRARELEALGMPPADAQEAPSGGSATSNGSTPPADRL